METTHKIQIGEAGVQTPAERACNTLLANTCQLTGQMTESELSEFLSDDPTAEERVVNEAITRNLPVSNQLKLF